MSLSDKEEAFCQAMTDAESPTRGDPLASARVAGYAENSLRPTAWRLVRRPTIRARLAALGMSDPPVEPVTGSPTVERESDTDREKHIGEIRALAAKAERAGDMEEHRRCLELIARLRGWMTDPGDAPAPPPHVQTVIDERRREIVDNVVRAGLGLMFQGTAPALPAPTVIDGQTTVKLPILPESTRQNGAGDARIGARDKSIEGSGGAAGPRDRGLPAQPQTEKESVQR